MKYPGMGDPYKRKKTLKFLGVSAGVGAIAVLITIFSMKLFLFLCLGKDLSEELQHGQTEPLTIREKLHFVQYL